MPAFVTESPPSNATVAKEPKPSLYKGRCMFRYSYNFTFVMFQLIFGSLNFIEIMFFLLSEVQRFTFVFETIICRFGPI